MNGLQGIVVNHKPPPKLFREVDVLRKASIQVLGGVILEYTPARRQEDHYCFVSIG